MLQQFSLVRVDVSSSDILFKTCKVVPYQYVFFSVEIKVYCEKWNSQFYQNKHFDPFETIIEHTDSGL